MLLGDNDPFSELFELNPSLFKLCSGIGSSFDAIPKLGFVKVLLIGARFPLRCVASGKCGLFSSAGGSVLAYNNTRFR